MFLAAPERRKTDKVKKIVFLDIDGTIQDFDGAILPSTVKAIQAARKQGHKICLCTGRARPRIGKEVWDIGFDGAVSGSGTYTEYEGQILAHFPMDRHAYTGFMVWSRQNRCIVEIETHRRLLMLKEDWPRFQKITGAAKTSWWRPELTDNFREILEVDKLGIFCENETGKKLVENWGSSFHIVRSNSPHITQWAGEILPPGINKAAGIKKILEKSGFPREQTIGIGDSANDLEMFGMTGRSVVMGNAPENIKRRADHVTAAIKDHGIWKAFLKEGLIDRR